MSKRGRMSKDDGFSKKKDFSQANRTGNRRTDVEYDDYHKKLDYFMNKPGELKRKERELERITKILKERRRKEKEPSEQLVKLCEKNKKDLDETRKLVLEVFEPPEEGSFECKTCGKVFQEVKERGNHFKKEHMDDFMKMIREGRMGEDGKEKVKDQEKKVKVQKKYLEERERERERAKVK